VDMVLAQTAKIQELMKAALHDGEHYGVIPGTERKDKNGKDISKKTLLKPGAEKLCLMFQFAPEYRHEISQDPFTVISTCTLYHRPTGTIAATGSGMCSTGESRYAWRKAERLCPHCGKPSVIKGQEQYGGGWVCWKKKEGCGATWPDGAEVIEKQESGRVPNPDIVDQHNTVLKIADKRSLVAAVLNATAASDIFTQDMEDLQENLQARGAANPDPPPTPEPEPANAEPKTPRPARAKKKTPDSVDTTATVVEEPPSNEAAPEPQQAIPSEMPPVDGKPDGETISAAHAIWMVAEAKVVNTQLPSLLTSFADGKSPEKVNYREFRVICRFFDKRRAMGGKK
jgi:hypothetical protein